MTLLKALGGTSDILPDEAERWQWLEEKARRVMNLYGFQEIRTPLIEETAVFTSSLGESAEIVTKQMYQFQDRGGRSVTLRPEGTASVVRAFIEHGLDKTGGLTRLYYLGPMFRAERPQAGRRRQFHQVGVEVFGSASPYQDVETLMLLVRLLNAWGLTGWVLKLNSLGLKEDRPKIIEQVRKLLSPVAKKLCSDCQERLEKNPLRILDCKELSCQELSKKVDLREVISPQAAKHFAQVTEALKALNIPFELDPHMVRGLDYYTRTAFEVVHEGLGAQNALGGGGRYDNLVRQMGGADVPAVGFAIGLERVLMALEKGVSSSVSDGVPLQVFVATLSKDEMTEGLGVAEQLRNHEISVTVNVEERPLKRQFEQANKLGCRLVILRGENERQKGVVTLKDMVAGSQVEASQEAWLETAKRILNLC